MSSPARSSASATSVGAQGGGSNSSNPAFGSDDPSGFHFPTDLVSTQDRKEEALAALKEDLMKSLDMVVKSLDEDNWKFAGPRSQIHLVSQPGLFPWKPRGGARRNGGLTDAPDRI